MFSHKTLCNKTTNLVIKSCVVWAGSWLIKKGSFNTVPGVRKDTENQMCLSPPCKTNVCDKTVHREAPPESSAEEGKIPPFWLWWELGCAIREALFKVEWAHARGYTSNLLECRVKTVQLGLISVTAPLPNLLSSVFYDAYICMVHAHNLKMSKYKL